MLAIYVVFFILIYIRINKRLKITRFLVMFYLISSICSLYLFYCTDLYLDRDVSIESVIYYCVIFSLFLMGVLSIEKAFKPLDRYLLNEKVIVCFSYFLVLISIISFYYSFDKLTNNPIGSFDDVLQTRNDFMNNEVDAVSKSNGILGYFTGPANMLICAKIFLFFYFIIFYKNKHKKLAYILLLCSLTNVVGNLTIVGRNAMMQWLVLLLLNYNIFFAYFGKSLKRKLKRRFIIILPLLLFPTIYITIARFSVNPETGMATGFANFFESILNYFGQGFINFSYVFDFAADFDFYGKFTFPIYWGAEALDHYEMNSIPSLRYALVSLNTFYTFIGSFYLDFGFWGTLLLSLVFYLSFKFISKIISGNLPSILLLLFSLEFMLMGVFYFMHWVPMFQKIYLLSFLCCLYLKLSRDFSTIHIYSIKKI